MAEEYYVKDTNENLSRGFHIFSLDTSCIIQYHAELDLYTALDWLNYLENREIVDSAGTVVEHEKILQLLLFISERPNILVEFAVIERLNKISNNFLGV